ncbi:MAG: SIMPL domain-containing protein, partial [Nitrososphaeraceae archaeon]
MVTVALSLTFFNDRNADAQDIIQNVSNTSNSTLFAVGNAQAMIKPDKVTLSLSVETTNTTANAALVANSEAMNKVLTALKAGGVRENETSTSFFNISPNYNLT